MKSFLKAITIQGIKNIDEPITLIFNNKKKNNFQNYNNHNVKAIYGPNGSGKSAIIHAFRILKDIIFDSDYLYDSLQTKYLNELLNKRCKRISIQVSFLHIDNQQKIKEYLYEINVGYNQNKTSFEITGESFINIGTKNETVIFKSIKGTIEQSAFKNTINDQFKNLLSKQTFVGILYSKVLNHYNNDDTLTSLPDDLHQSFNNVFPLIALSSNMNIILDDKDNHLPAIKRTEDTFHDLVKWHKDNEAVLNSLNEIGYSGDLIKGENLETLEKVIKNKTIFIKLFKPDVKAIDLEKKLIDKQNDKYSVNQYVNYGDYSIDVEFESTGVKKLLALYDDIKNLTEGKILLIDELDSHINDVYLVELVQFISEHAEGQLIFTTHNISPMDILKSKPNSIDFMSSSSLITPWKQVGNYSPRNVYKNGLVRGLPFNIKSYDFLKVFTGNE